jgi:hypothetical protein
VQIEGSRKGIQDKGGKKTGIKERRKGSKG